jgi:hypothetical protein
LTAREAVGTLKALMTGSTNTRISSHTPSGVGMFVVVITILPL